MNKEDFLEHMRQNGVNKIIKRDVLEVLEQRDELVWALSDLIAELEEYGDTGWYNEPVKGKRLITNARAALAMVEGK